MPMTGSRSRTLSYSEITTALTCQALARHAFRYTGHLTEGRTLRSRQLGVRLWDGRAWGAAVAAYHSGAVCQRWHAHEVLGLALLADAREQIEAGVPVNAYALAQRRDRLGLMLDQYINLGEPLEGLQ